MLAKLSAKYPQYLRKKWHSKLHAALTVVISCMAFVGNESDVTVSLQVLNSILENDKRVQDEVEALYSQDAIHLRQLMKLLRSIQFLDEVMKPLLHRLKEESGKIGQAVSWAASSQGGLQAGGKSLIKLCQTRPDLRPLLFTLKENLSSSALYPEIVTIISNALEAIPDAGFQPLSGENTAMVSERGALTAQFDRSISEIAMESAYSPNPNFTSTIPAAEQIPSQYERLVDTAFSLEYRTNRDDTSGPSDLLQNIVQVARELDHAEDIRSDLATTDIQTQIGQSLLDELSEEVRRSVDTFLSTVERGSTVSSGDESVSTVSALIGSYSSQARHASWLSGWIRMILVYTMTLKLVGSLLESE
ncbi:hypothetical protein CVT24_010768 [Panaeolus cyanescens]|uniref:Uncharacterized protein n=1 Tax=Panaeolus cyanescens TaxID=181874 RepID=A0A409YVV1_9AGAR|nr:hypothetical protein CVT24_010768 [Panaeolus cyanescens]